MFSLLCVSINRYSPAGATAATTLAEFFTRRQLQWCVAHLFAFGLYGYVGFYSIFNRVSPTHKLVGRWLSRVSVLGVQSNSPTQSLRLADKGSQQNQQSYCFIYLIFSSTACGLGWERGVSARPLTFLYTLIGSYWCGACAVMWVTGQPNIHTLPIINVPTNWPLSRRGKEFSWQDGK